MVIEEYLGGKSTLTFIAVETEGYGRDKRLATEITPDKIKQVIDRMLRSNHGSAAKNMTAFGVAARTIGGKTYMAIGVTFVGPTMS